MPARVSSKPASVGTKAKAGKSAGSAKAQTAKSPTPMAALAAELRDIAVLGSVGAAIGWDQETMMPPAGGAIRAEQREMVSRLVHERRTSPRLGELIDAAEQWATSKGDARAKANLREIRRDHELATKLPVSLVAELMRCASLGMEAWKEARQKSEFKLFLPWLTKTIELSRQKARCYGPPTGAGQGPAAPSGKGKGTKSAGGSGGNSLYDALLDEYEPGMTAQATREVFDPLRARLVPLIERASGANVRPSEGPTRVETPLDKQKQFVRLICEKIGFDFSAGRMDESAHPFCDGIGPGDTRMTNRYRADGWIDALGTAMHESGHALYEQGLPKAAHFGQPLAEAVSLGIHESQSRLWENLVGRSRVFWKWATPLARQVFGDPVARWSDGDMYKAANLVKPGLIRVESDEVTYNLHIMLRFDLERAMIDGELSPKDLPGVWNERMKSDLGLAVPDDRRGCLQDVHWSMGLVGYFPTYTFGNLYAAQFWEKMGTDLPDRDKRMGRGDFSTILGWLRENIHAHGRQFRAADLCRRVTGAPLSHDALLRHLDSKVKQVYGV